MMQVTYQKRDGSIMQKFRKTELPYRIGDETSMGWKVLNIEYEYENKFYPKYEYNMLKDMNKKKIIKMKKMKEICIREIKNILYYFIVINILYYIKIRIGI